MTTPTLTSTKGLLSLSLLSNGKPQSLSSPSGDAFFTLYVPTGTTPVEFIATMLIRGPVTGGIATITTPTNVYPENLTNVNGASKFSAPLTAGDVQNGIVNIHVHIDLNLDSKYLNPSGCTATSSVVAQIESANGLLSGSSDLRGASCLSPRRLPWCPRQSQPASDRPFRARRDRRDASV
ncbi:MAG: hypothetical protein ACYC19_08775, partial [Acidimicrobiales bacterium]